MQDLLDEFRRAMKLRGLVPPSDLIADGKIHRCDVEGRNGKRDGAYLLHTDGIPAGGFENWQDGRGWDNWRANVGRTLTAREKSTYRDKIEAARRERKADETKRHAEARKKTSQIWNNSSLCRKHAYLSRKGIKVHDARISHGNLVLPLRDSAGVLHSLQFIDIDGNKRFLSGGRVQGNYSWIGEEKPDGVLCITEGFATGASVHEATGYTVAVTFFADNLNPVAETLRKKFPDLNIIVCADDDYHTSGNPGKTKGIEAARNISGYLVFPDFGPNRPHGATDFNDLHLKQGLDAVRHCIEAALQHGPATAPEVPQDGEPGKTTTPTRYGYGGGEYCVTESGVSFISTDKDGNKLPPRWICSPLHIVAKTRDAKSGEWGRLLEWQDDDKMQHRWAMPLELLQGDGTDVWRELARLGLSIAPGRSAHDQLASYLQVWPVKLRARCVDRLGWHGVVFVTPIETIGNGDELVVFQNAHAIEPALTVSGTADEWRETVACLAEGNTRLVFALSVAFAGALMTVADEDSGGFHLRGASSSGKTTVLKVAASVWGNPSAYMRLWRATANGLEALASLHNDSLLILDELSQIDPREAGEAAYLLANGQGKTRASRNGTARAVNRWRLLFLSSGEESLSSLVARVGKRASAGQELRLADIDADAGAGMGGFEQLNGHESPAALALAIKDAATRTHGAVGLAWLHHIVTDRVNLLDVIDNGIRQFVTETTSKEATATSGQAIRVARRVALVAVAGELATHYGLTGWQQGEAERAAKSCFDNWLESFGVIGNREERALLAQVRAFFEAHGASRFEDVNADESRRIINRAGFFRIGSEGDGIREFLVLPESFKREVCNGFDAKVATRVLVAHGWIAPGGDGRPTQKPRLPGIGTGTRVYVFTSKMWESDE